MLIKVKTPDDQYVQINAEHITVIRAIDGGCIIELSNGKSITSVETDLKVGQYVKNAYTYFHRQSE